MRCRKPHGRLCYILLFVLLLSGYRLAADTLSQDDLALALMRIENSLKISRSIESSTGKLQSLQMSERQSLLNLGYHEMSLQSLMTQDQQNLIELESNLSDYQVISQRERDILAASSEITRTSEEILRKQEKRLCDTWGGRLLLYFGIPVAVGVVSFGVGYIIGSR